MKKLCFLLFSLTTLSPALATQNITFAQCVGFLSLMLSNSWEKKMQGQEEDLIDDIKALEALNEKTQDLIKQAKNRRKDHKRLQVNNVSKPYNSQVEIIKPNSPYDITGKKYDKTVHDTILIKNTYSDSESDCQGNNTMGWNKDYTKNCYTGTEYNIEGWTWCGTKHQATGTMFGPNGWNYSHTRFISDTKNKNTDDDSDSQEYDIMGWNKDYTKNCYTGTEYNIEGWTWCGTKHQATGTMFGPNGWNYDHTRFISDTKEEEE